MAIRTSKFRNKKDNVEVRAVKVTLKNIPDLVGYIGRNGGAATGHQGRPEFNRPARIRVKQVTFGKTWFKKDWRVANLGDWIVRYADGSFARVKADDFTRDFVAV